MGLFSLFKSSGMVYFPGDLTYFRFPDFYQLYLKIFSRLGINVNVLDRQKSCGLVALEAGYENEARKLMWKNLEDFKSEGVKRIITSSPESYVMFSQNYSSMLPDWEIEVVNLWELILNKLRTKSKLIKHKVTESVGYHDSCYLGRYSGIYNEPREILKLLGYKITEFQDSKEGSFCCGSCGGLPISNPRIANKIAKERLLQAKRLGIKKIIVSSLENYDILKQNSEGIDIVEFSEVLAIGLGIKKLEKDLDPEVEEVRIEESNSNEENEIVSSTVVDDDEIKIDEIDLKEEEEIRQEYYE